MCYADNINCNKKMHFVFLKCEIYVMSLVVSDLDPILYRQKYFYIDKPGLTWLT